MAFLTTTVPFAAAWTGLFAEMIADCHAMRWRGNGPGVGRDARIAYSGLLGRYIARAYLTAHEGVRVLVPLDEAKRALRETAYCIRKHPHGRGLVADWIGLDDRGRLVIAEAKGSFDKGVRTWSGANYRPDVPQTAIDQAARTEVFRNSKRAPVPGALRLRVGRRPIEPGFAALVGPVGIHALRERDDLDGVRRIRELNPQVALASLSSRYASALVPPTPLSDEASLDHAPRTAPDPHDRFLQRAGLTVA